MVTATKESSPKEKRPLPPYGPVGGMLEGLGLLQRTKPPKVDTAFLQSQGIAPRNEYKVVGALRYLDLINDEGTPTEKCKLLRTRGPDYTQALQDLVKSAYAGFFRNRELKSVTGDAIYNYFVTEEGLGPEMAAKASRFFVALCQQAGLPLPAVAEPRRRLRRERTARPAATPPRRGQRSPRQTPDIKGPLAPAPDLPLVFSLSPLEMDQLDDERLTQLFRKVRQAWERSAQN
ncbi:MAG: DUF5343 domain-containing protein [Chloroflexi bacterium]|nr:DUF5343 domain-containing protein [Chloroflexota bacterium]